MAAMIGSAHAQYYQQQYPSYQTQPSSPVGCYPNCGSYTVQQRDPPPTNVYVPRQNYDQYLPQQNSYGLR